MYTEKLPILFGWNGLKRRIRFQIRNDLKSRIRIWIKSYLLHKVILKCGMEQTGTKLNVADPYEVPVFHFDAHNDIIYTISIWKTNAVII